MSARDGDRDGDGGMRRPGLPLTALPSDILINIGDYLTYSALRTKLGLVNKSLNKVWEEEMTVSMSVQCNQCIYAQY